MTRFEDTLWDHLVDNYAADQATFPQRPEPSHRRHRMLLPLSAAGALATATAATLAVVFAAGTSAPPAYALTVSANGTYTLTINDLTASVARLNTRFAQAGVRVKLVPIEADCGSSGSGPFGGRMDEGTRTITFSNHAIPKGATMFIAASPARHGKVLLAEGFTTGRVPACFTTDPSGSPVQPPTTANQAG